jgi:hypothetical protein
MWSNHAFLFLQESLAHKQLSLITKTSPRGLEDSHRVYCYIFCCYYCLVDPYVLTVAVKLSYFLAPLVSSFVDTTQKTYISYGF